MVIKVNKGTNKEKRKRRKYEIHGERKINKIFLWFFTNFSKPICVCRLSVSLCVKYMDCFSVRLPISTNFLWMLFYIPKITTLISRGSDTHGNFHFLAKEFFLLFLFLLNSLCVWEWSSRKYFLRATCLL